MKNKIISRQSDETIYHAESLRVKYFNQKPTENENKYITTDARFATIIKVFKALDVKVSFKLEHNNQKFAYLIVN